MGREVTNEVNRVKEIEMGREFEPDYCTYRWYVHFCPVRQRWVVDGLEKVHYAPPPDVAERVALLDAAVAGGRFAEIEGVGLVQRVDRDNNWIYSYMFFEKGDQDENRG